MPRLGAFLERLRALPFVRSASFSPVRAARDTGWDGILKLATPGGAFRFRVDVRLSYLDRVLANSLIAVSRQANEEGPPLMLFARYVPQPTAWRLVEANVNFVDLLGNMHLSLEPNYVRTVIGRVAGVRPAPEQALTRSRMQLLFTLATRPEAVAWPVRKLAAAAGVSKSKAAVDRRYFLENDAVRIRSGAAVFRDRSDLEDRLLQGYSNLLRPKLVVGRFRGPYKDLDELLKAVRAGSEEMGFRYALTGGPAAETLRHLYRGPEIPIFLTDPSPHVLRRLRLLPDRSGPIALLRAFGEVVFWRSVGDVSLADPWLIYAELMNSTDPRAHEAAGDLRQEFLSE